MKKILETIFIVLCLSMCAVLSVGYAVNGPAKACANEVLAPKPAIIGENGKINDNYLSELSHYFSGRFFLRRELITVYAKGQTGLFGTYVSDDVVSGKDGWLYYKSTVDDFVCENGLTPRELYSAGVNLALMQEYCESQGVDFAFMAAPNKNTLYGENMPFVGSDAENHDMAKLYALLDSMGVKTVDLAGRFAEESDVLYFAHDSHWTSRGAALGADLVNEAFGRDSRYYSGNFSESASHTGDLFEMLYPAGKDSELDFIYGDGLNFEFEKNSGNRPDSITIRTHSDGDGSIVVYRDSFGNSLYQYLADSFGKAYFSRSTTYDMTKIAEQEADAVLIELVERNLSYLVKNFPVLPAPERQVQAINAEGSVIVNVSDASKTMEGYVLAIGQVMTDEMSGVCVIADDCAYECFLMDDDWFAAYIPADAHVCAVSYTLDGKLIVNEAVLAENN